HTPFTFFFINDTSTTILYTLSLHDALPISCKSSGTPTATSRRNGGAVLAMASNTSVKLSPANGGRPVSTLNIKLPKEKTSLAARSEEHTSELQSRSDLVCRLLLEKKKKTHI